MRASLIYWIKRLLRSNLNHVGLTVGVATHNILTLMVEVRSIASLLRNV